MWLLHIVWYLGPHLDMFLCVHVCSQSGHRVWATEGGRDHRAKLSPVLPPWICCCGLALWVLSCCLSPFYTARNSLALPSSDSTTGRSAWSPVLVVCAASGSSQGCVVGTFPDLPLFVPSGRVSHPGIFVCCPLVKDVFALILFFNLFL